jgi:predicted acylesterase/phospholipase RssA
MTINRKPPTELEIKKWFIDVPALKAGMFEFALVLGGTVSAGAYTAGAMDFLIEALDCLSKAQRDGRAPQHKVRLKLIAGTSGGGVNAAIAARGLAYKYPHIARGTPIGVGVSENPFYDTWINTLRLGSFLDTSDIGKEVNSLLNGKPIDAGAEAIIRFASGQPALREWIAEPLRIIITLTSLRGVPYKTNFGDKLSQGYVDHADFARFAVVYPGQTLREPRPDEMVLSFGNERLPQATDWEHFSQFARATAAFPVGFPARALSRPTEHYRWRVVAYPPSSEGTTGYLVSWPDWDAMVPNDSTDVPDDWHFLAVDGGATDNEPIQLARTALAGLLNRNPRDAKEANRAVWLIDPFAGRAPLGPEGVTPFPAELSAIATTLTQQTRYDTADLLMAADANVFSRFMLSPTRGTLTGEEAIASGGLGAFIGFACPAFMRFDYLLGRQNCQRFLRKTFVLDQANKVFKDWSADDKTNFRGTADPGMLPIIPLIDDAAVDETMDPWPKGKLDPEQYRNQIEQRFRAIFETELSGSLLKSVLSWVGAHATQREAADYIVNSMRSYLKKAGL